MNYLLIKQSAKQALIMILEQFSTLMCCEEFSFLSEDAGRKMSEEIDGHVLALFNLSSKTSPVNGIEDLLVEMTPDIQNGLVALLLKDKWLFVEQDSDEWPIHSMTKEEKQELATANKDMVKTLQDLPIKTQHCIPDLKPEKKPAIWSELPAFRKIVNINQEDEYQVNYEIPNIAEGVKKLELWWKFGQFNCNGLPWHLEFKLCQNERGKSEISVMMFCDYETKYCKDWSVATICQLRLLSQVEGGTDKEQTWTDIFKKSDKGYGFGENDLIDLHDLLEASNYVKNDKMLIDVTLKVGPLAKTLKPVSKRLK